MKRITALFIILIPIILLSGCRVRLAPSKAPVENLSVESQENGPEGSTSDGTGSDINLNENPSNNGETVENPEADRKEFDEHAAAEIVGGTDRTLHEEGEGSGAFTEDEDSALTSSKIQENAKETALHTISADEADETGVSEDGKTADSMMDYYTAMLRDRGKSLYECKRAEIYWETGTDFVTVYKTSQEHRMILNAGAYDVSARLLEENLTVDSGWVARKNPTVIVKIIPGNILGNSVRTTEAAETLLSTLRSREGWSGIDAVRQNRILLLSEELLSEPHLQLAAMLAIAKTANPELYEDLDPSEALTRLITEVTGSEPDGVYIY